MADQLTTHIQDNPIRKSNRRKCHRIDLLKQALTDLQEVAEKLTAKQLYEELDHMLF